MATRTKLLHYALGRQQQRAAMGLMANRASHLPTRLTYTSLRAASSSHAGAAEEGHDDHSHGHGHEDHYDAPGGWLWGVRPGEEAPKEGWEGIWVYGFFGTLVLGLVAYGFKPDSSIQTWALEEARRRLEVEGILSDEGARRE